MPLVCIIVIVLYPLIQSSSLLSDSALPCVAFPWYHGKDLVKVRLETIPPTEELQSSGEGVWGVFGWGTVEPASREVSDVIFPKFDFPLLLLL